MKKRDILDVVIDIFLGSYKPPFIRYWTLAWSARKEVLLWALSFSVSSLAVRSTTIDLGLTSQTKGDDIMTKSIAAAIIAGTAAIVSAIINAVCEDWPSTFRPSRGVILNLQISFSFSNGGVILWKRSFLSSSPRLPTSPPLSSIPTSTTDGSAFLKLLKERKWYYAGTCCCCHRHRRCRDLVRDPRLVGRQVTV